MSLLLVFVLGRHKSLDRAGSAPGATERRPGRETRSSGALRASSVAGMPREIANYTKAVNDALERILALMQSQRVMTSAISHEVRTPLAMARLELEKIADPRARKVEADLDALNRLVEQLTTLARLEGAGVAAPEKIDPVESAQHVVEALAPLVFDSGRTIAFEDRGAASVSRPSRLDRKRLAQPDRQRHPALWRGGDDPRDGRSRRAPGGFRRRRRKPANVGSCPDRNGLDRPGLGLKIVSRIAEIHGGRFEMTISSKYGATATIVLPRSS